MSAKIRHMPVWRENSTPPDPEYPGSDRVRKVQSSDPEMTPHHRQQPALTFPEETRTVALRVRAFGDDETRTVFQHAAAPSPTWEVPTLLCSDPVSAHAAAPPPS